MRLFIAINFPLKVKDGIVKTIEKLVPDFPQVSWTKKENIHLTIKFLGSIYKKRKALSVKRKDEEELLDKIKQGIEKSIERINSFELFFDKLGFFEREKLIIWMGAKSNPQFSLLIEKIDIEMGKVGFIKERREFTPHITVGRGKHLDKKILQEIKQAVNTEQFVLPTPFTVSTITLMNSDLTFSGPIYTPLSQSY